MAFTIAEMQRLHFLTEHYGIDVKCSFGSYGSTTRKMRGKNARTPDWVINHLPDLRDMTTGEGQEPDWPVPDLERGYWAASFAVSGYWGALVLAGLHIEGFEKEIADLRELNALYLASLEVYASSAQARVETTRTGEQCVLVKVRGSLQFLPSAAQQKELLNIQRFLDDAADGQLPNTPSPRRGKSVR